MNRILPFLLALLFCWTSHAFTTAPTQRKLQRTTTSTKLYFFGQPKDDGSPGDYVCKDCGYIFTKGPQAWAALDDRTYKCPPCGAPKFRFKKFPKVRLLEKSKSRRVGLENR